MQHDPRSKPPWWATMLMVAFTLAAFVLIGAAARNCARAVVLSAVESTTK